MNFSSIHTKCDKLHKAGGTWKSMKRKNEMWLIAFLHTKSEYEGGRTRKMTRKDPNIHWDLEWREYFWISRISAEFLHLSNVNTSNSKFGFCSIRKISQLQLFSSFLILTTMLMMMVGWWRWMWAVHKKRKSLFSQLNDLSFVWWLIFQLLSLLSSLMKLKRMRRINFDHFSSSSCNVHEKKLFFSCDFRVYKCEMWTWACLEDAN